MNASASAPDVLVVVGTDVHPFDRLVTWVDEWLLSRTAEPVACLVQYGTSRPPRTAGGEAYLDHAAVEQLMERASVVVTHGGPTTISEARRFGHRPVVVPRRSGMGEHVDDHQVRFTKRLSDSGLIDVVGTGEDLARAVEARLRGEVSREQGSSAESVQAALAFGEVVEDVLRGRSMTGPDKRPL